MLIAIAAQGGQIFPPGTLPHKSAEELLAWLRSLNTPTSEAQEIEDEDEQYHLDQIREDERQDNYWLARQVADEWHEAETDAHRDFFRQRF